MIPKIIHYCWLSKDPIPTEATECMRSWKKYCRDYEFKLWSMDTFDVNSVPFVKEAVAARKWAFACDFIRCYALFTEGGIYLDSDVLIRGNIDFVLGNRAFSAIESYPDLIRVIKEQNLVDAFGNRRDPNVLIHGIQIQAAILGAEKGHPFFKDCLDYYYSHHFEGTGEDKICPIIMASIAEKYGFRYMDVEQDLDDGFKLYSADLFCPQPYMMKPQAVAVHCCNASWRATLNPAQHVIANLKIYIKTILVKLGFRKETAIDKIK